MAESSNIKARDIVKGVFSSYAPVTMNSIDSARTVASDIRTIGRKINTGMRQNMMQIDKSQPGRRAIALFNAAKDALKDGTYEINQANDGMYDDFEEYESSFTLDDMTEDERANSSPEEIILRGNRGVAQSVIRATTAQLEGMDAVSNKVLRGFIKTADASTKSINATIIYGTNMLSTQLGTMNTKLDAINANLVNLIEYQNENTTTYYEKNLEMMNSMLESMNNLNAMTRGKGARDLKNFDVRNGFNIKDYIDRVKKGIKNSAMVSGAGMITSMTNMAKENPDIMSLGEIYGNGLAMVASMIPAIGNKMQKVTKIDKRASQYINETLLKIGDKLGSNMLATMLGLDSLGNQRRRNYGIDMSGYMKDQIPWNGKAQKALTEVIPELLTSIDAGINKTDKRYFDYEQGYFKSRKEIEQDFADQVSTSISLEFNEMINRLGKKFDLSGKTPEEIAAAKSKVSNIINNRIYGEGDLSTARQEMADTLQSMNLSANEFSSAFNNIEQAISSVTDQIAELYSRVGSTDSVFRNINNRSGATSREAIGKEAYRTLKAYRTSGAKETSIFRDGVATDVKETIDRITRTIQAEIPEFRMTTEYKQYINMAVRRGDDDYEILRAVKNTFGKSNAIDLAKKKIYGLFGKDVPIPVPEASDDDNIDLGRYGNAVDMALLHRVYGVKTNYPGVKAAYQSNKEGKSKSRSKNGVGDTTLTNKAASSQRSRIDGKSAGAEVAHVKTSPSEGMRSEFPINQDTENLKGAIIDAASQSADKILNADDSSLDRDEKLRDTAAQAIIDIGKEGSTSFGGALKNVLDTMVLSMGSMMSSFTSFGARLFGKEGIIKNFFKSDAFKSGMNKVKEFLIGDENGIFKDQWAKAKAFSRKTWNKTKDKLTDAYDWVYRNYSTYKYGEGYEEKEDWQNDKIMQKLNLKKRREEKKADLAAQMESATDKLKEGKSSVPEVEKTADEVKSSVDQIATETPVILKESVEKIADAGSEAAQDLKESTEKITTAMIGDPNANPEDVKKKYTKTFTDKVKSILPKVGAGAIIGAGVGFLNGAGGASLLGSMFLPTGLIGGAIVGGGLTILSQTEAFRSLMFGKKDKDGNRSGGLISKNLKDKFKKAAPIAVGGAVTGMISSVLKAPLTGGSGLGVLGMQLLPGGILGGAIMGMGVGLLKNSDTFKNILFGKQDENGERKGTWLSKSFGNMKQKMAGVSPFLKNALKGGAVGAVTGATLAHMGVLGAAVSSGPIGMGIAGLGLGIASSTKKFQDWLFGTEEFDDNGNSLGRKNGYLGRVKNMINANIIEPIAFSFKKNMVELVDWTKDKITLPFRTAFGPILDSISGIKDNVVDFVKDRFEDVGNGITSMIRSTLGKLFSPITTLIGKVGSSLISGAKVGLQVAAAPLSMGLQGLNVLTMGKRRKDYKDYRKAYLAQEEAGGMNNRLIQYWDAKRKDGQKVGFFDKISDTIDAYMGRGEIAESFRKGYVQEKTEQGQNNLGWLTAKDEKKQLRIDRRQKNKAFKQWEKVDQYGRKLANEFGGREVELTPAMFEKYKKKFVGLGVNADQINDSSDIMDLIYRPSQFKKKAAGDSGRLGELEALSKFRLTDEEKAHMATTEKYQTNVEKLLEEIRDSGKITAEELMFDREMTSYKEDRKRDNKRLRNKLKKAYKTSLWEGKQAINLNDPELYEYDIEGITDEDLQDYAASNFADNNDFKGYLESIGRKMSPNDDRVAYQSAVKVNGLWKRSTGKTSEEKPPESKPNTNDATQAAVLDELKQTRELQEANLELQSGGEITADKVKKNGYKDFGKSKMSKFSIGGVLTNLFNRKSKEDKTKEAAAKEAEEQKQATALGDEANQTNEKSENATIVKEGETKEKKKSIFSRIGDFIFGGLGTIGAKVNSNPILKTIAKFGKIAIPAILGVSVLDMVRPGIVDKIGVSLDEFNKSVDDGSFVENVKTKIINSVEDITTTVKGFFTETKLGKSMAGVFSNIGKVITETAPTVIINTLERLPEMAGTVANWIGNNSKLLVNTSIDVVEKIGPPLIDALVDNLPTLAYQLGIKLPLEFGKSIFKKLVNTVLKAIGMAPMFKDEELEDNSNLSKTTAESSEKNYQVDKSAEKEYLTPEEAAKIAEQGGVIRHDSQGMYEEKYVVPTENIAGFDDEGNPIYVNNTGVLGSAAKLGLNAGAQAIRGGGKLTKAVSIMGKVGKALVKPGQLVLKTAGTISKGAGAFLSNTFGKLPILGIPSKIAGGVFQDKGSILNGLANPIKTIMGTADEPSLIGKAVNGVKSVGAKLTNTKLSKIATEKIVGKSATMADDAAKVAADSATSLLAKITTFIKGLKTNKTLLNILDKFKSVISKEVKPLEVICNFLDDIVKAIGRKCTGKLATKITNMLSKGLAKAGATSIPVVTLVSGAWGVTTGAMEAENLFGVDEADGFMIAISAIMKGLLSISFGCIFDLLFEIASAFLDRDIKQEIAMKLYKLLTADSPKKYEDLVNSQNNQDMERQIYNKLYGLNLDTDAYNDLDNSKVVDSVGRGISNAWYTITGQNDKKTISTKNMSEAVNYLRSAGYSDDQISSMSASQLKSAVNSASGGKLSFGSGPNSNAKIVYGSPYAQGNSEWANMPIGTFANGKVSTMGTGGCGPTALSAIANMYGNGMSPADMGKYASLNGYITQGGANERLFTEGAARLGMQSSKVTKGNLRDAINSGKPTIISGTNSGPFTKVGHVVVANGTDRNGNAIILDPSDGKIKSYNPSQLESGMTGAWSYAVGYGNTNPITIGNLPSFGFNTLGNPTVSNDINMALNANSPLSSEAREEALRKVYDPLGIMTKDQLTTTLKNDGKADVASRLDDKYSNKKSTSEGKTSNESLTSNNTSTDTVDMIPDLQATLAEEPTSLGGLFGAFQKFGNAMRAVVGVIKGEGTFSELYNKYASGDTTSSDNELTSFEGSGNYTPYAADDIKQQEAIWNYLINNGYTKTGASGIMGCWQIESANRADRVEGDYLPAAKRLGVYNILASNNSLDDYTTSVLFPAYKRSNININQNAYKYKNHYYPGVGLAQWTGVRGYNLLTHAKSNGGDWRDLQYQLQFADKEINDRHIKSAINSAGTPSAAAQVVLDKYEMYNGYAAKHSEQLKSRQTAANKWYETFKNLKTTSSYGRGPVGFGPDEDNGPSNWNELLSGASAATDYLQSRLDQMGIGEYLKVNNTAASIADELGTNSSVSFDPSMWANSPDQLKPVNVMRSIYGQLNYSQEGAKQNPEKGVSSCASTVAWAYNKALGIRPGDTVGSTSYMRSTEQSKDNRFTTIWTNNGSGLTDDFVKNYMQPGDIVYQNWNQTYNNGKMGHTEMYAGNGQTLSHGGPNWSDKGPVYKNLLSNSRKKHTMMIRRYNGFLNNNTTGYGQGSSNDRLTLENNFLREVDEQKNRVNKTRLGKEGDSTVGFGPGSDNSNLEERLDKIFNVITEWYLMEKKKYNTKGFGPGTVTNTTVVNNDNSTKVIKTPEKKQTKVDFNSNLDKLTQKHSAFARMYKTSI